MGFRLAGGHAGAGRSWGPSEPRPRKLAGTLPDSSASADAGPVPNIGNEANFVEIDQGDGTSALYLHLSQIDPAVLEDARHGGQVRTGDRLGWSGRTGNTGCHPHLHFQVQADSTNGGQSVPIAFGDCEVPAGGATVTSDNANSSFP